MEQPQNNSSQANRALQGQIRHNVGLPWPELIVFFFFFKAQPHAGEGGELTLDL